MLSNNSNGDDLREMFHPGQYFCLKEGAEGESGGEKPGSIIRVQAAIDHSLTHNLIWLSV